jgi:catechol 2,3-dioxygenase
MSDSKPGANLPKARLSHLGLCATDLATMEAFYCRFLGMTVTDRGEAAGMRIVFLSRDPNEHHQLVLTSGRPRGLPQNQNNPMFGPVVNQISFRLDSLADLRKLHAHIRDNYATEFLVGNHGIAWSVYFPDPEGNIVELFVDSEWYVEQPVLEPFDLSASDDAILAHTRALCQRGPRFQSMDEWRRTIAQQMR